jgi:hypothetical protein
MNLSRVLAALAFLALLVAAPRARAGDGTPSTKPSGLTPAKEITIGASLAVTGYLYPLAIGAPLYRTDGPGYDQVFPTKLFVPFVGPLLAFPSKYGNDGRIDIDSTVGGRIMKKADFHYNIFDGGRGNFPLALAGFAVLCIEGTLLVFSSLMQAGGVVMMAHGAVRAQKAETPRATGPKVRLSPSAGGGALGASLSVTEW